MVATSAERSDGQPGERPAVVADVVALVIAALVLAIAVAVETEAITWRRVFLWAAIGLAVVTVVGVGTHVSRQQWFLAIKTDLVETHASSKGGDPRTDTAAYWFLPVAALAFAVAAVFATLGAIAIWDLAWEQVWPWLLVIGAVLGLVATLMALSYAPPGPNWVQRIAGVDGGALLMMLGIAIVCLGTLQYFEFDESGGAPSDWWLAVVGGGLLAGLIGISRSPRPASDPSAASRAAVAAGGAEGYARRALGYLHRARSVVGDGEEPACVGDASERAVRVAQGARIDAHVAGEHEVRLANVVVDAEHKRDEARRAAREAAGHYRTLRRQVRERSSTEEAS